MTVSIHQPNFLPWLGYFYKILNSDYFVILDDVEYTKNSFINRNKIKTPQGKQWITVPVIYSGRSKQKINESHIFNKKKSIKKVIGTIEHNYKKALYFEKYFDELKGILETSDDCLSKLNIELISWILDKLEISKQIVISSSFNIVIDDATDRLIEICKKLKATEYFSGFGGQNYQEARRFQEHGISVVETDFKHPIYPQLWGEFIPNLSVIDILFNCGNKGFDLTQTN